MVLGVEQRRLSSGIEGFDDICGGGLPEGQTYLLAGGPGAGKSTFALQFLVRAAVSGGEPGIYIACDQTPDEIRRAGQNFDWDIPRLERDNKLGILDALSVRLGRSSSERWGLKTADFTAFIELVTGMKEYLNARRVVLDSVTSLFALVPDYGPSRLEAGTVRSEVLKFAFALKESNLTPLLILERGQDRVPVMEQFLVDGVIQIYMRRIVDSRVHAIEVLKLRNSDHSRKIHPLTITPQGVVVNPKEFVYGEF